MQNNYSGLINFEVKTSSSETFFNTKKVSDDEVFNQLDPNN